MPSNSEALRLLPSDRRYFEVNLIQDYLQTVANLQIAQQSLHSTQPVEQHFVAGRRVDIDVLPPAELAATRKNLEQAQLRVLTTAEDDYVPNETVIAILRYLGMSLPEVEDELSVLDTSDVPATEAMALVKVEEVGGETYEDGAWPTGRSEAEWDRLFVQSAFFAEDNWVAALFAKELVFRPFGESNV